MTVKPFEPKFMKIGVLTAALQELTPREVRDRDPDRAVEDWAAFARELGADYIQLSAALHPSEADVPAEAMLDPVANTLDLREPFNETRARRLDRSPPHLRSERRRGSVPHPLRSVARDIDGAGHALDLPVPEGRRLRLPHRRLPRQGAGHRRARRRGLGLRRADDSARRLE